MGKSLINALQERVKIKSKTRNRKQFRTLLRVLYVGFLLFYILKWKIKCEMSSLPTNTGKEKLLNVAVDVYAPYATYDNTRSLPI
jgi:hypothetical protein